MTKRKKLTILVTGALGHIGSKLIRELPEDLVGAIILLDNFESQRYPTLFNLPENFKYRFIEADVRSVDLNAYLKDVDVVIHLAALTNAETSHEQAKEVESVNLEGLKKVADVCLKSNVKLIFPSTTSVYGSQESLVDENCQELKPQSPYAESKLAAEHYLQSLKYQGLKFVICRFGTIFGYSVGMRFHTAVNKFIWQAVNGLPLTVWKTALKQKRPYLELGDCVRAISFILENNLFDGEIYNVLTQNYTVEDVVNTIKKFTPQLTVNYVDSPIMNQLSYEVSDSKFKNLGFETKGEIQKSIEETIMRLWKLN